MHFLESEECKESKTFTEPNGRMYQVNNCMTEDIYSVPTTSRCYQRPGFDADDSFTLENYSTRDNAQFYDIAETRSDSEGNPSTKTSKKRHRTSNKVLKINSSCDSISREIASTVYDAAAHCIAQEKIALKKSAVPQYRENKAFKNENRVMFLEQNNYGKYYNFDQCSSHGSSSAAADSIKFPVKSEQPRREKTTNCRPVPNVHCKEVTTATVERNARLQKLVKKIARMRQKERQVQQWNTYIESLKNKHRSDDVMDDTTAKTSFVKKKFTDEVSGTDIVKGEFMTVSVGRSEATSVMSTLPFDPDTPVSNCYQNIESVAMPYNFGFYRNQACFYPSAYSVVPHHQQYLPYPQFPYFQMTSQQERPEMTIDILQDCKSITSRNNQLRSVSKKKYLLVHTSMQTDKDFGVQVCEKRENQTNTEGKVSIPDEILNNETDPVLEKLTKISENIDKLRKKNHRMKTHEVSLINIEDKLDTLMQSINSFMTKTRAPALPSSVHDECPPSYSSTSTANSTITNNKKSLLVCSQTAAPPSVATNDTRQTSSRAPTPHTMPTSNKSMRISQKTPPPRKTHTSEKVNKNIGATRSEPHRVQQPEEVVCNVMASAGDSFIVDDRSRGLRSSRSKLDIIRTLLEEIENNRVTRDTDSALNKGANKYTAQFSTEIAKKECWTVTDSLSMTPLIEQPLEEVCLERPSKVYYRQRPCSSNSQQRIMSIAVNTDPLSIFSLFRISKDAVKQLLSYVPQIDTLLPRYLKCSSYFGQTTITRIPHYSCNICGASFMRPSQLSDHIASHSVGTVKNCCVCRHVLDRVRADIRPGLFACQHCGQHFTRAYCCQLHQQACAQVRGIRDDVEPSLTLLK